MQLCFATEGLEKKEKVRTGFFFGEGEGQGRSPVYECSFLKHTYDSKTECSRQNVGNALGYLFNVDFFNGKVFPLSV